jgi:GT2 family glycosyltransferase
VGGKFFRLGEKKFYVKGVSYGPFAPNAAGQPFASPEQTARDFTQIRELGANLIRVYHVPSSWFLDLAAEHELKVLIDIPWRQKICFLDSPAVCQEAREAVRRAVYACSRHPAVFAFSVANEIPPDVVRWTSAQAIADFLDELIQEAKRIDPECLCTFTNFPPTEFLRPQAVDFVCFNVYLHQESALRSYLARLQMLADAKPLLLGEFGIDSLREGESRKSQILSWTIEAGFRGGLAGTVLFSYTDDWWHNGKAIEDWSLGLTTRDRQPKESFRAVQQAYRTAPYFLLPLSPKVSVVICSYNGDRTLKACLDSVLRLNYPNYEVILVDDGSDDTTPQIASLYPAVRFIRHADNLGLSAARNTGIAAASGEVIAFTDSDCRADEDWLYYAVSTLLDNEFAGVGGPNLLPLEDSAIAAAVMVSPGGPAHVMLTDRQAEHIPGCNMVFYKTALESIGGFDPIFRQAGDDVDLCWRLQQAGYKIGFNAAAFVWHYRRSTVRDYLKQQSGYGEAEALLVRKHPEYFNSLGGSIWRGRIYGAAKPGITLGQAVIYRGLFGSAGYQAIYSSEPTFTLTLFTTLEYHVLITLPAWVLSAVFPQLIPIAVSTFGLSLCVCAAAGAQAELPKGKSYSWSRPLVALLFFLQPIVRGWARYRGRLFPRPARTAVRQTLESISLRDSGKPLDEVAYWSSRPIDRFAMVADILQRLDQQGWPNKADIGWSEYDVEIYGSRWNHLQLITVTEDLSAGKFLLRCRLRPRWSLQSKVGLGLVAGAAFLSFGVFGKEFKWLWLLPLVLPLFAWFLHREQRNLQSMFVIFLDDLAKSLGMTRYDPAPNPPTPAPAPPDRKEG